jgi:hypothetical protein
VKIPNISQEDWSRLIAEGLDFNGKNNVKFDFVKMSKKFGASYLTYLQAAYDAKHEMSDFDFCNLNGNVPIGFLKKLNEISK